MNKLKKLFRSAVFFILVITAMQAAIVAQNIEVNYDFHRGALGWTADFADYPPNIGTEMVKKKWTQNCLCSFV